ncbi:MAG: LytR/AlgR family response regulator transcription factor [Eisenbergiella sp.]
MIMNIAICEDDAFWQEYLKKLIYSWSADRRIPVSIQCFPSAKSFLFALEDIPEWELLILDIEMGSENGMELAEQLRQNGFDVPIIFATGYTEYMSRGFDVDAIHYLLKPIEQNKLSECLDKAFSRARIPEKKLLFPAQNQTTLSLRPSQISHAEASGHYSILYADGQSFPLKLSFSVLTKLLLADSRFLKCHRCYLVNLCWIAQIQRYELTLDDKTVIPVSRTAFSSISAQFLDFYKNR